MPFSQQQPEPSRLVVLKALNRFIDTPIRQKRTLLEREQALLLTDTAEQILTSRIKALRESDEWEQRLRAELFEFHRWLLHRSREKGIAAAWQELEKNTASRQQDEQDLYLTFLLWVQQSTHKDKRRFLEAHSELLTMRDDTFLEQKIAEQEASIGEIQQQVGGTVEQIQDLIQDMRDHLALLREIRERDTSVEATHQVYVDKYGGLVLDTPEWLSKISSQLESLGETSTPEQAFEQHLTLLRKAIARIHSSRDVAPEALADLYSILGVAQSSQLDEAEALEEALTCFKAALQIYTPAIYPRQWMHNQFLLGRTYQRRIEGEQSNNIEQALACYNDALRVQTPEHFPGLWADIQAALGDAYTERIEGEQRDNLEEAIAHFQAALRVRTREKFPRQWAAIHGNLGQVYLERIAGDKADNIEQAILCFRTALEFFTEETSPEEWANIQRNLGEAYIERVQGNKVVNLEQALSCYRATLVIYSRETTAEQWAYIQTKLGNIYQYLAEEKPDEIEQALSYYTSALEIVTRENNPRAWANIYNNIGHIYHQRRVGDKRSNMEQTIAHFNASLQVYISDAFPLEWASLQENLGSAYGQRIEGKEQLNLEQAIAYYEAALQVYTRDDYPEGWARVQGNLGVVYRRRIAGEGKANLEQSIKYLNAALEVYTLQSYPNEWAATQNQLGQTYLFRIQGDRRDNLEQAIACHEAALQVFTRGTNPHEWARIQNCLGKIYIDRLAGEPKRNREQAIAYCKAALEILKDDPTSVDYAEVLYDLGNAYFERLEGDRRDNLEQAIAYHEQALSICTREAFPEKWAGISSNLGMLYTHRIAGERRLNIERALAYYEEALKVHTFDAFPPQYARLQSLFATAYNQRIEGNRSDNLERAIFCNEAALQILTLIEHPWTWASIKSNMGLLYQDRQQGNLRENLEQAIAHYKATFAVYPYGSWEWATTMLNLGNAYQQRIAGEQEVNLRHALACYDAASAILTREASPSHWATVENDRAFVYWERTAGNRQANLQQCIIHSEAALTIRALEANPQAHLHTQFMRGSAYAELGNWAKAHEACLGAREAENLLLRLGSGTAGRDPVLKGSHELTVRDSFVLVRMGHIEEAAVVLELGRARGLAEALSLDAAAPELIHDQALRERYRAARQQLINAQAELNMPPPFRSFADELGSEREQRQALFVSDQAFHAAQSAFNSIIEEIRKVQPGLGFLSDTLDAATILRAAECGVAGHALVYLAATPWGGLALAALSANPALPTSARILALDLPALTENFLQHLGEIPFSNDTHYVIGGFYHAQEGGGMIALLRGWHAQSFRAMASSLRQAIAGRESMLHATAQKVLSLPALASVVDKSLNSLSELEFQELSGILNSYFLQYELERCLPLLREAIFAPLIAWLVEEGATSLTLIPCGPLAAFPLMAVPLTDTQTVGDRLPTSVAPNARSLLKEQQTSNEQPVPATRKGLYAFGDPRPTRQPLLWSEAEALTLVKLAREYGLDRAVHVQQGATRARLIQALQQGMIVDASCHGVFDVQDFRKSALLLAKGQKLQLGELLSHTVDLRGLRLLILSACQTAILDLRGAVDEVHSLAAGVLQAGAQAALASLWSVNDRATYLLMVRFAQEWLPKMEKEAPAAALARAQRWLRTVTNRELSQWEATPIFAVTEEERKRAGATIPYHTAEVKKEYSLVGRTERAIVRGYYTPYHLEEDTLAERTRRATARERDSRYDIEQARAWIHYEAVQQDAPDACPYAHPIYWAGFQITGW